MERPLDGGSHDTGPEAIALDGVKNGAVGCLHGYCEFVRADRITTLTVAGADIDALATLALEVAAFGHHGALAAAAHREAGQEIGRIGVTGGTAPERSMVGGIFRDDGGVGRVP